MNEFDADTAVVAESDLLYRGTLTDRWDTFAGPNGGYVLAVAARALGLVLPQPHPLSVTGHFLRRPRPGDVAIAVEQIRSGRRHATALARVSQDGKEILTVLGTFTDLATAEGRTLELGRAPELPPVEDAVDPSDGIDPSMMPPIGARLSFRTAGPPGFASGAPTGDPTIEASIRFADRREPDPLSLVFFPDAVFPTVFEINEFVSATVEMTVHVRAVPAPGWLSMRVWARHIRSGYHEEDVEIWDSAGVLVTQARQLALLG